MDEQGGTIAFDSIDDRHGLVQGGQWTDGIINGALDLDGVDDYVALPDNSPVWLPRNDFCISLWVKLRRPPGIADEVLIDMNFANSSRPSYELGYALGRHSTTNGKLQFYMTTGDTDDDLDSNTTLYANTWYHVVAVRQGQIQSLYINGELDASRLCDGAAIDFNGDYDDDNVHIGRYTADGIPQQYTDGIFDDVRLYNGALSQQEIQQLYLQGSQGLLAHWQFDEGQGSVAADSVGGYHGTVYGAQWTSGMLDGAIDLDGVDDYVALPDNEPVWLPRNDFCVAFWIKPRRPLGEAQEVLVDLNAAGSSDPSRELGYNIVREQGNGRLSFNMTTLSNPDENLVGTTALLPNKWYHVVVLRSGTVQSLYVNGELDATRTCSSDPIDFVGSYDDDRVNVGRATTNVGLPRYHTDGIFDDLRIYSRALTEQEIQDMYIPPAEPAIWHVDEQNGDNANDGLSAETALKTIAAAIAAANNGDTILLWPGNYFEPVDFLGKAVTVHSAADAAMISGGSADGVTFHSGEGPDSVLRNVVLTNSKNAVTCNNASSPTLLNLTIANNDFGIAAYENSAPTIRNCILHENAQGDLFDCIAEHSWVQREQSAAEPGLVSHWKFDSESGTVAFDSVGNNHGTIHGATWTTGYIGSALDYSATGDYVEIPDSDDLTPRNAMTLAFWLFNQGQTDAGVYKFASCPDQPDSPGNSRAYALAVHADDKKLWFRAFASSNTYDDLVSSSQVGLHQWHHVAVTFNNGVGTIYIDGLPDRTEAMSVSSIMNDAQPLTIGAVWDYCGSDNLRDMLTGKLDDLRLYNRVLSADEIQSIYSSGSIPGVSPDPLFADPAFYDFHLKSKRGRYWSEHDVWVLDNVTSPAVDAGDPDDDFSVEPQPNGGRINIGAYGGTPYASMNEAEAPHTCSADLNTDGIVNMRDLAVLALNWLGDAKTYNAPPTVAIESPSTRACFLKYETVSISAEAADPDGQVVAVEFYIDGTLIATDGNPSDGWTAEWEAVSTGSHDITAVAVDDKGATGVSEPRSIEVDSTGGGGR